MRRIFLLPERRRLADQALSPAMSRALGRADRLPDALAGEREQLLRYFQLDADAAWPLAAITREADMADAGDSVWLLADPAFVRSDINGARLMAWGNLRLSDDEAVSLVEALQPAFAELGAKGYASSAERWHLRLPAGSVLPRLSEPDDALGTDLLAHLPAGEGGRAWRRLLNEAQVILHNHPVNARRAAQGMAPVNSIWLWGGGRLPRRVGSAVDSVATEDADLRALARLAGVPVSREASLVDLRRERDWAALETLHLLPALAGLQAAQSTVQLDFADGARWQLHASQRFKLWRRPSRTLGSP